MTTSSAVDGNRRRSAAATTARRWSRMGKRDGEYVAKSRSRQRRHHNLSDGPNAAVRNEILQAAGTLGRERGYELVSMSQVAGMCGLSTRTVYWHFRDEDELIAALIEQSFDQWILAVAPLRGSARERLTRLRAQIDAGLQHAPELIRFAIKTSLDIGSNSRTRAACAAVHGEAYYYVAQVLRELMPDLSSGVVHELSTCAVANAYGSVVAAQFSGNGIDARRLLARYALSVYVEARRRSRAR